MANLDLPLILVIASILGSIIYLFDLLVLKKKREQALAAIKQAHPQWQIDGSADKKAYQIKAASHQEHAIVRETKSFLPIILLVLVIRSFIIEPFQIPSSSMEPGLDVGDFILVNKFTYGLRLPVTNSKILANNDPQRGEIMVFFPPNDNRYFIKRVIGLPGDHLEYKDKTLYINGIEQKQSKAEGAKIDLQGRSLLTETFAENSHLIYTNPRWQQQDWSYTVSEGHYFMMGDNRDNSSDSRVWGEVPEKNIVGKAFFIWMHWKSWKSLPSFDSVGSIQ